MTPFATLTAVAAPLLRDNVDTDAIIPSREMRSTGRTGLADGLFAGWRYLDADARTPDPDFVLNRLQGAQILLSGRNFGCGSSREHAVWALLEYGMRCVVAESFAPIFETNCIRNGLLPVTLPAEAIAAMAGRTVTVDLGAQTADGHRFDTGAEAKAMLLKGVDTIDLTLERSAEIAAWQAADRAKRPWVYLAPPRDGEGDRAAERRGGGGVGTGSGAGGRPPPPPASPAVPLPVPGRT